MTEVLCRSMLPAFTDSYRPPISYLPSRMSTPSRTTSQWASENKQREREGIEPSAGRSPTRKLVRQWLAGTAEGSPRTLHPLPPAMNGTMVNPPVAQTCGGSYGSQFVAKANAVAYQGTTGFYGHKAVPAQTLNSISQPTSPSQSIMNGAMQGNGARRRSSGGDNSIVSYLQIPSSINNSKGSLAEFAAQITCLFWFESSFALHRVEESKTTPIPTSPLVFEARPTMGFRKWVTTMLSTTQVTQNVILLALMFIYRLKKLNPTVKGKPGSEFRLLTVALMLGNKFLDDNTYTNKTWAEVSGISVQEIHIMEVEFLSNMRYTLYASEQEWALWHKKLGRFWEYFERASQTPLPAAPSLNGSYALPSPPTSLQASPPFATGRITNGLSHVHPLAMPPHLASNITSFAERMPEVDMKPNGRKRSYDSENSEPPAKRISRAVNTTDIPSMPTSATLPMPMTADHMALRLPIPNLSVSTNGHSNMFTGSYSAHLPPPTSRAMSMVYQGNQQYPGNLPTPQQANGSFSTLPPMNDHLRRSYNAGSRTASPTAPSFPPNTQDLLSPSGFPPQRNSPYRPLRSVNTLLVPPPSASFQNPSQNLGYNNMHYQPLGKPLSERKTGVVPYMQQEPWQQGSQMTHCPYLPQPVPTHTIFRA